MSYMGALEAAGAKIIRHKYFGDYQGTILAEVEYEGQRGYISIAYGSCDHCDAYQAFSEDLGFDHVMTEEDLANFGRNYLDDIGTHGAYLKEYTLQADWDTDAGDVVKWLNGAA